MAIVDITKIPISTITTGLEGKLIGIYGGNSTGKTSTLARLFPGKTLWLATENGTNAQSGLRIGVVEDWNDFRIAVSQLTPKSQKKRTEIREMFKCVVIDVADKLPALAKDYILKTYNTEQSRLAEKKGKEYSPIKSIQSIPYGAGWDLWRSEHDAWVNRLYNSGICVCSIFHPELKTLNHGQENEYTQIIPKGTASNPGSILRDELDFVIYLEGQGVSEDGKPLKSKGYCFEHKEFFARSRFAYCPEEINPFTPENLRETIRIACEKEIEAQGCEGITNEQAIQSKEEQENNKLTHTDLINMIEPLYKALVKSEHRNYVLSLIADYFGTDENGRPNKISQCTEKDRDILQVLYNNFFDFAEAKDINWEED